MIARDDLIHECDDLAVQLTRLRAWYEGTFLARPRSVDEAAVSTPARDLEFEAIGNRLDGWVARVRGRLSAATRPLPTDPAERLHAVLDRESPTLVAFSQALRAEFGSDIHVTILVNAPDIPKPFVEWTSPSVPPTGPKPTVEPAAGDSDDPLATANFLPLHAAKIVAMNADARRLEDLVKRATINVEVWRLAKSTRENLAWATHWLHEATRTIASIRDECDPTPNPTPTEEPPTDGD